LDKGTDANETKPNPSRTQKAGQKPKQADRVKSEGFFIDWGKIKKASIVIAVITAVYSTLATSLVETVKEGLLDFVAFVSGDTRVSQLEAKIKETQIAHAAEVESLQMISTAFIELANRDQEYCFLQIQDWIKEEDLSVVEMDSERYRVTLQLADRPVVLRCIGAKYSDTTFITLTTARRNVSSLDLAMNQLNGRLWRFRDAQSVVEPDDQDWKSEGPFGYLISVRVQMSYENFVKWQERGELPDSFHTALSSDGSKSSCRESSPQVCTFRYPRFAVSVRAPTGDQDVDSGIPWISVDDYYLAEEYFGGTSPFSEVEISTEPQAEGSTDAPVADPVFEPEVVVVEGFSADDLVTVPVLILVTMNDFGQGNAYSNSDLNMVNRIERKLLRMEGIDREFGVNWIMVNW
jgi:hypothetical protein